MDRDIKHILDAVVFIKERVEQLPTEERVREIQEEVPGIVREEFKGLRFDVKVIREELRDVRAEVKTIREELEVLKEGREPHWLP